MTDHQAKSPRLLRDLYASHSGKVSDKWTAYLPVYERLLASLAGTSPSMLEIGIQNGGALEIWARSLPDARHVIGCDINPQCGQLEFEDTRISVVIGDANSDETQAAIAALAPRLNFIVDDGSHTSHDIIHSFVRYFPCLIDGGIFVAEDLHCSYWEDFEGGLFHPASSMAFFKRLADVINHEHWGVPCARADALSFFARTYGVIFDEQALAHIHSVEFINSMCVIHKQAPTDNVLGARIVRGRQALVFPAVLEMDASESKAPDQGHNAWSLPASAAENAVLDLRQLNQTLNEQLLSQQSKFEQERETLHQQLRHRCRQVQDLEAQVAERDSQLETARAQYRRMRTRVRQLVAKLRQTTESKQALVEQLAQADQRHQDCLNSVSWKVTAPLRAAARAVRRGARQTR
jgi:hypothetical protein